MSRQTVDGVFLRCGRTASVCKASLGEDPKAEGPKHRNPRFTGAQGPRKIFVHRNATGVRRCCKAGTLISAPVHQPPPSRQAQAQAPFDCFPLVIREVVREKPEVVLRGTPVVCSPVRVYDVHTALDTFDDERDVMRTRVLRVLMACIFRYERQS